MVPWTAQDTNTGDPAATKKFFQLTLAYEVLLDDEKRKAYDAYGHSGLDESGGSGDRGGFSSGGRASAVDIFNFFEEAYVLGFDVAVTAPSRLLRCSIAQVWRACELGPTPQAATWTRCTG